MKLRCPEHEKCNIIGCTHYRPHEPVMGTDRKELELGCHEVASYCHISGLENKCEEVNDVTG